MPAGSARYWQRRYRRGGSSGDGSRSQLAAWKADRINQWAHDLGTTSVLDIGCGDGRLAGRLHLPGYLGVDPAPAAVKLARHHAPGKQFAHLVDSQPPRDLHLSIDVMFHLPDDVDYRDHLALLFAAERWAVVHATDFDATGRPHVRHRRWTADAPAGWRLLAREDSQLSLGELTVWERM